MTESTINIIGSGNVATHFALALKDADYKIENVASRNLNSAEALAQKVDAKATTDISSMGEADITIIAVSDNAIGEVAKSLADKGAEGVIAHTSGATPMAALEPLARRGVLYPCMTFTKGDDVNMKECPFLVEACDEKTLAALKRMAARIGNGATECDSEGRNRLHLAAVLASNFTNHMLLKAQEVLRQANLPLSILKPLTMQTISKAFRMSPIEAQTGPARRDDTATIGRHEAIIDDDHLAEIYGAVTKSIIATYWGEVEDKHVDTK